MWTELGVTLTHYSLFVWNYEYVLDHLQIYGKIVSNKDEGHRQDTFEVVGQAWAIMSVNDVDMNIIAGMIKHKCNQWCKSIGLDEKDLVKSLTIVKNKREGVEEKSGDKKHVGKKSKYLLEESD